MNHRSHELSSQIPFRRFGVLVAMLSTFIAMSAPLLARPVPKNLGGGLEQLAQAAGVSARAAGARSLAPGQTFAAGSDTDDVLLSQQDAMIVDDQSRVLVKVTLTGRQPLEAVADRLRGIAGTTVTATDANYQSGVIEAYVHPAALVDVANAAGVLAVVPSSKAVFDVGLATTQGIVQHRLDKVPAAVNGGGITVGVLSDSYNASTGPIKAANDIASGDLPGAGNPLGNAQPVVVLEDRPTGTDEGRAMLQIVHDIAPQARLGFATANTGEVGFANNIRSLARLPGAPNAQPGFKADVIVDDVIYLAEPFFQDGIVAQAVDDVAEAGVAYFSSAGNRPASQAYDAKFDPVPAEPASLAGTNLDFTFVDPALYAGGFHNFAGPDGLDIAQTIVVSPPFGTIVFQWNEPFDPVPPIPVATIASGAGTTTAAQPTALFTFAGVAGQVVTINVDGDPTNGNANPDVTIALFGPDGTFLDFADNTTSPESLILELPDTGTYTVEVGGFLDAVGDFVYQVEEVEIVERVVTDFNLLFFRTNGQFLGALAEQNRFTNRPLELGSLGPITVQLVIARANVPPRRSRPADRLRYVWFTSGQPQEHFSYVGSVTYGHNSARGANGVAAYAFYPPFIPEPFTSPGFATIYFDRKSRRLRRPEIRLKPDIAAMDGANNTFFSADAPQDADLLPNFFGTSAAAPHAAGIAALVLQAAGGPRSLKPERVRDILQDSAFPHDLDPFFAFGLARTRSGGLVAVSGAADPNAISQFDPNVFTVANFGGRKVAGLTLDLSTGNTTQTPRGLLYDTRAAGGVGQPFIIGSADGLTPADVTPTFTVPADLPGLAGQWKKLTLDFAPGTFGWGDSLGFGVDRDEADVAGPGGAAGGNSADLLGAGVLIPQGTLAPGGATFTGTLENGDVFSGKIVNQIGDGYSRLDGFGFINAEAAVKAALRHKRH